MVSIRADIEIWVEDLEDDEAEIMHRWLFDS